jgi:hypothetical protein
MGSSVVFHLNLHPAACQDTACLPQADFSRAINKRESKRLQFTLSLRRAAEVPGPHDHPASFSTCDEAPNSDCGEHDRAWNHKHERNYRRQNLGAIRRRIGLSALRWLRLVNQLARRPGEEQWIPVRKSWFERSVSAAKSPLICKSLQLGSASSNRSVRNLLS